jgi:hypothetical protein
MTSTSNLRKHLYSEHIEEWVTGCDDLKIKITAEAALPAVRKFRAEPEPTSLEAEHQEYTKEAFVEAILEFIVGDDQVCFVLSNLSCCNINITSVYQYCGVAKIEKDISASS